MNASTVFTTISITMLANGVVLAIIYRELPTALRVSARYWQAGTLLIAIGCALFAFGSPLPRPIMLTIANGSFVFALTAYHAAVMKFDGKPNHPWYALPAIVTTICVFWFSAVTPDFRIRLIMVSLVWAVLMVSCLRSLMRSPPGGSSLSRSILAGIFAIVAAYVILRLSVYLYIGAPRDLAVETDDNSLNLLSAMFMTVLPITGTTAFLLMCTDSLRRKLEQAASTDYLTGLPNRRSLAGDGEKRFERAREQRSQLAVAALDIDSFKAVNDRFGHEVGDRALIHVASLLQEHARNADMIARSGGEEFVVLLSGLRAPDAVALVERMRDAVARASFEAGGHIIPLTISAGVAVYKPGDRNFDETLRRADHCLYSAKSQGRNRVETSPTALTQAQN